MLLCCILLGKQLLILLQLGRMVRLLLGGSDLCGEVWRWYSGVSLEYESVNLLLVLLQEVLVAELFLTNLTVRVEVNHVHVQI